MLGYLRPHKGELKIREFEEFHAVYCGLCFAIKKRYGNFARLFLSYDFTYLALALDTEEKPQEFVYKRCLQRPFAKHRILAENEVLNYAADVSALLIYEKVKDTSLDERGWKAFLAKVAVFLLKKAFRKASARQEQLYIKIKENFSLLHVFEDQRENSMDKMSDLSAQTLAFAAHSEDRREDRILKELFYHIGRWIYIIDACDDLEEDVEKNRYNPVYERYKIKSLKEEQDQMEKIKQTLYHSIASADAALSLLNRKRYAGILENVIRYGMPLVTEQVFSGLFRKKEKME